MGAFDQFKDQADDLIAKGKRAAGDKRDKAVDADNPREMAERGARQGQERRPSDPEDRERMDSESDDSDNWR